ncbi:uncharacterized protein LOC134255863 isoform X1 [Saccostrea cucullata]|uniref:uncharacterized protein LOC134255863 isoform X1 n=2 Tax=Saccostrea cuccullata TaxID=36930 RepID=UPI002ED316BD
MSSGSEQNHHDHNRKMTKEEIIEFLVMALQSNGQILSRQTMGAEQERRKSTRIGNIKKPKKLLSERFGSIARMETGLKNPQHDECGASVHPLNQELIDFERGTLHRKYNNLKVNVKIGVVDQTLSGPDFNNEQVTYCPVSEDAVQKNSHGSIPLNKDVNVIKPYEESTSLMQNAVGRESYREKMNSFSRQDCNVLDKEQQEVHAPRSSYNDIKCKQIQTNNKIGSSEAIKRPFFYAEQNSVPPKKRYTIDQEMQKESQKMVDSFDRCTNNNLVNNRVNGYQANLQQGESTPSSTCSDLNNLMLFEGRTLLKGGVNPRHIPKNIIERHDKEPPTDPRLLRPNYGQENQIVEYKVLMWHKDWLLDYTRMLIDERQSQLKKREQERLNASTMKERDETRKEKLTKSKNPTNEGEQLTEVKTVAGKKVDSRSLVVNIQRMEDSNNATLKAAVSRLVEDVRISGAVSKQCFEYGHSGIKTEIPPNSNDPRLKNRCRQQSNNTERIYRKSSETKKEQFHKTEGEYTASRTFKDNGEKRRQTSQRYDAKLKDVKKNSPNGVSVSRGKTGAVLREDSRSNSPNVDLEDKEFKVLQSTAMHSTYYNRNLSPIYQEKEHYNSYRKPLPKAYQVSNNWNSKGKDRGLDRFPQFSQQNWY